MYLEVIGISTTEDGVAADTTYRLPFDGRLIRAEADSENTMNKLVFNAAADNPFGSSTDYTVPKYAVSTPEETENAEANNGDTMTVGDLLDTSLSSQDMQNGFDDFGTPVMRMTVSNSTVLETANSVAGRLDEGEIDNSGLGGKTLKFTKRDGSASVTALCTGIRDIGQTDAGIIFLDTNIATTIIDGTDNGSVIEVVTQEAVSGKPYFKAVTESGLTVIDNT